MLSPLRMKRSAVTRAAVIKLLASQHRNHHQVYTSPFSYLKNLAVADSWSGVGAVTPELTKEEDATIRPYYSVEDDDTSSSGFLGSRQQHWDEEADEHTGGSTLSLKNLGLSLEENWGAADSWWSGVGTPESTQTEEAAITVTIGHSYSKVAGQADSSRYLGSRQWPPKIITTTRSYHSGPSYSSKMVEAENDLATSFNPSDDSAGSSRRQWWPSLLNNNSKNDVVGRRLRHTFEARIPLAVAGPLEIYGDHAQGRFLAPMATTEGAIVASANRGAAALNQSGRGVTAYTSQLRASACPVFEAATPRDAHALGEWVKGQLEQIQREVVEAEDVDSGVELKEIISVYDLQFVHLLLKFETAEVTAQHDTISRLSSQVAKWIAQKAPKGLQLKRYWRESQLSGDKKCSRLNTLLGHGLTCGAEAVIPETVLTKYLGVHSSSDLLSFYRMIERASDRSLSMGSNGNVANITAAVFAATGQDLGSCVDAGAVRTQFTLHEGAGAGVRYTLWIPSLVIGAKEDDRPSSAQRQCLDMMGCSLWGGEGGGSNVNVRKLAEIVAAFGIALDISTIASVVAGQFTQAHEKLGKNRPT